MKIKENFIIQELDNETILIPAGGESFSGMVRGNKTFGIILKMLKEDITEQQLITAMKERFEAPEAVIERDVKRALNELRRIGAIDG